MTRSEWNALAGQIVLYWPQRPIEDGTLAAWFLDVEDLPYDVAESALRALARDGREWPPTGGQIRAKAVELVRSDPDHGRAWELVRAAVRRFGTYAQADAMDWLAEQSPATARAVARFGWRELCLYDITDEQVVRAQFRDVYNAVAAERDRDSRYAGLGAGERRGELHRPAFAAIAERGGE